MDGQGGVSGAAGLGYGAGALRGIHTLRGDDVAALVEAADKLLRRSGQAARSRRLARIRKSMTEAVQHAFYKQEREFVKRFTVLKGQFLPLQEDIAQDWEPLFNEAALVTAGYFETALIAGTGAALTAGAEAAAASLEMGISFTLQNPRAVAYLEQHGARLVANITATTKEYIRTVITQGVAQGWSYDRMAAAIINRYQQFAVGQPQLHIDSRAHLIAVTEAGNSYEEGSLQQAYDVMAGGQEMEHAWLTVGDNRVEPDCMENEAAGWITFPDPFPSGNLRPLEHPACRCTAMYRAKVNRR